MQASCCFISANFFVKAFHFTYSKSHSSYKTIHDLASYLSYLCDLISHEFFPSHFASSIRASAFYCRLLEYSCLRDFALGALFLPCYIHGSSPPPLGFCLNVTGLVRPSISVLFKILFSLCLSPLYFIVLFMFYFS